MELQNPMDFPIVMVRWLDSIAPREGGWYDIDLGNLKKEPLDVVSAGFLLRWTDEVLIICSAYYETGDKKIISTIGSHSIPHVSITEMEWLYQPENYKIEGEESHGDDEQIEL